MTTLYWGLKFTKVALCYIFVLFIWPSVVFRKYLRNKSKIFRFCFCATTQIVLINTAVLCLGLLYLLNPWVVNLLFYGVLLFSIREHLKPTPSLRRNLRRLMTGTLKWRHLLWTYWAQFTAWLRRMCVKIWKQARPHLIEYIILSAIVVYGVIYFSYSPFVNHSYGFGDMYTHHSWIYGMTEGKIFSAGVYPEGMHCVVYLMHTISGITVYNCNLFLGCIHISVYLLSAYCLMREIFRWRGTPLCVLTVFLVAAVGGSDLMVSMSRLQRTLPGDYGLYTVFLCALFLLRFLKEEVPKGWQRERPLEWLKNENLLIFYMSLAASIAIHFYVTIIAFFVCLPFAIVFFARALSPRRFQPLVAAVLCGVTIAMLPMGGALLSGIPFQGSIGWALSIMSGEKTEADMSQLEDPDIGSPGEETPGSPGEEIPGSPGEETPGSPGEETPGSPGGEQPEEPAPQLSLWETIKLKAGILYRLGYCRLTDNTVGSWMVRLSLLAAAFWLIYRLICMLIRPLREAADIFDNYLPIIGASLFVTILYAAPYLSLPEFVSFNRVPSTAYILLLMVAAMPVDVLLSAPQRFLPNPLMQSVSLACVASICAVMLLTGYYHGYFYGELTRYRSVVDVTSSIIETFPRYTYTIVSSTDELYGVIQYGRHEELLDFLKAVERGNSYYLPTEYVFVYVEKKPIKHAQYHFSSGPSWLATDIYADNSALLYGSETSKYPNIFASEISDESADMTVGMYPTSYNTYRNLTIRTIINSKANKWCHDFADLYDHDMKVYYEDDDFVCYYFRQNTYSLYDLSIWHPDTDDDTE